MMENIKPNSLNIRDSCRGIETKKAPGVRPGQVKLKNMETKSKDKQGFVIYKDFYEPIKELSDEQLGKLFRAIFLFQIEGITEVDPEVKMAFMFFKNRFIVDIKKYDAICKKRKESADKRWDDANASKSIQKHASDADIREQRVESRDQLLESREQRSEHNPAIYLSIFIDMWTEYYQHKHSVAYTITERDKRELTGIISKLISHFSHSGTEIEITEELLTKHFKAMLTRHNDPYRDQPKNCRPSIFNSQFTEIIATIKNSRHPRRL